MHAKKPELIFENGLRFLQDARKLPPGNFIDNPEIEVLLNFQVLYWRKKNDLSMHCKSDLQSIAIDYDGSNWLKSLIFTDDLRGNYRVYP